MQSVYSYIIWIKCAIFSNRTCNADKMEESNETVSAYMVVINIQFTETCSCIAEDTCILQVSLATYVQIVICA